MRIISLSVENFLRVEAAEIRPEGDLVVIAGPNEAGKSTLINAIWTALGGEKVAPEEPIRQGAKRAQVTLELGDGEGPVLMVERIYTESGSRLRVSERREDGEAVTFRAPQAMLSAMLSSLAFDPEAFARMKSAEQAAMLAELTGLDTSDLDAEEREVRDMRRAVGRRREDVPMPEGEAPRRVDVAELTERLSVAQEASRVYESWERDLRHTKGQETYWRDMIAECESALAEAKESLAATQREIAAATEAHANRLNPRDEIAELTAELRQAGETNARSDAYAREVERAEAADAVQADYDRMSARIDEIMAERAERIAACEMPVDGLSIEDGKVLYEGRPFAQASTARRLDISLAIGMAQNPKLRVLRIEHGSLLDERLMDIIATRCAEHGYQAWVEVVANRDEGVGIYIEDGKVTGTGEVTVDSREKQRQ